MAESKSKKQKVPEARIRELEAALAAKEAEAEARTAERDELQEELEDTRRAAFPEMTSERRWMLSWKLDEYREHPVIKELLSKTQPEPEQPDNSEGNDNGEEGEAAEGEGEGQAESVVLARYTDATLVRALFVIYYTELERGRETVAEERTKRDAAEKQHLLACGRVTELEKETAALKGEIAALQKKTEANRAAQETCVTQQREIEALKAERERLMAGADEEATRMAHELRRQADERRALQLQAHREAHLALLASLSFNNPDKDTQRAALVEAIERVRLAYFVA